MKKIVKLIENCMDCYYCEYDSYYNEIRDSGYNCNKSSKRIVDDAKMIKSNFPKFPEWCPLPDATIADQILIGLESEEKVKQVNK